MHPALDQLQKVLKLEIKDGYPNKAVIGGLTKMLVFWEPNARRGGLDPAFIDAVAAKLKAYPELRQEERPAAIQSLLQMVRELASATPTSPATAARPPSPPPNLAATPPAGPGCPT